jgi:hypothetical protein
MFFDEQPSHDRADVFAEQSMFDAVVDGMISYALYDARQAQDPELQREAQRWLWVCCPDLAEQLDLPVPEPADYGMAAASYVGRHELF